MEEVHRDQHRLLQEVESGPKTRRRSESSLGLLLQACTSGRPNGCPFSSSDCHKPRTSNVLPIPPAFSDYPRMIRRPPVFLGRYTVTPLGPGRASRMRKRDTPCLL